jgi:antitoxin (DNA-binding transcriptional repressor) of toxin-antitoxin stability system
MTATAKDLRFNISMLFDVLSKGEEVLITYRGKTKARLLPYDAPEEAPQSDALFGLWRDRDEDVDTMVRQMRKGRDFGV